VDRRFALGIKGLAFHSSSGWCVAKHGVDSLRVVVVDVLARSPAKMLLIDHDYVVEQIGLNGADLALCDSV
jgi:hypothetical protein